MNNLIIGTAGHVDHGKTALIKALTGTDTDRLKAEKERGITIELGFAYLALDNGQRVGIIDVPGHEKFVRNMLAGAGGIDLALFIVAADEGVMPQSREHLEILTLLNIKRGVVAITKTDLVERDWLDLVALDVEETVKGTFLQDAPVAFVSAKTGAGIDDLKKCLSDMILQTTFKQSMDLCRLPIDRVFTVGGFGTVVTGTLVEGTITAGDELTLYPSMQKTKVRGLQVHSQSVETAKRGQRVAVNLAGIKTEDIKNGCVLATPQSMLNSCVLEVRLNAAKSTGRKILNNSRLHFYLGTFQALCRVNLLGKEQLLAGESCYARIYTDLPISAKLGDRFVVRFYSPLETVGGGVILDPNPPKRVNLKDAEQHLKIKESGSLSQKLACFILEKSKEFPAVKDIKINPFSNSNEFDDALTALAGKKEIFIIKDFVIHKDYLGHLAQKCKAELKDFHAKNPLLQGMKKEELRFKLFPTQENRHFDEVISLLAQENVLALSDNLVRDKDFFVSMTENQKKLTDQLTKLFLGGGFTTPSHDEVAAMHAKELKTFKHAMDSLTASGVLIMLTDQIIMHSHFYGKAIEAAVALAKDGQFTLAQFRDYINTSRKYAVALLEHFDNKGITKKQGDFRILGKKI